MSTSDRWAWVTGASSGIGTATALALAEDGWNVIIGYNTQGDAAQSVASAVRARGTKSAVLKTNLQHPPLDSAIEDAFSLANQSGGTLECLVNNAGVNHRTAATHITASEAERVLTVNYLSPLMLMSGFADRLAAERREGCIINVTSVHENLPITGGILYCGSKAALGMASRVMALEMAGRGIRVNSVAPGETATPMNGVEPGESALDYPRPAIPMGRPGHPNEIASVVAFLASSGAQYVTGASLTVDGGLSLVTAEENARYAKSKGDAL